MKNEIRQARKKGKKIAIRIRFFMLQLMTMLMITYPVYAGEDPKLVSGTKKLIAAVTAILTALVTAMGTFNALKVGTKWINASPEERPKHQKELVLVIIATVVTLTIGSTITYIVGFYS